MNPLNPASAILDSPLLKYGLIALSVGGLGFVLYKMHQSSETNSAQSKLDDSPEAQQANNLLALLHPYSYKGLQLDPFATVDVLKDKLAIIDKTAVIRAGTGIHNLDKVSGYYKQLTGDRKNLPDDLRDILSAVQMSQFYRNVNDTIHPPVTDAVTKKVTSAFAPAAAKPFDIYAAPNNGQTLTAAFQDAYLAKPLLGYTPGTKMGKVLKSVTVALKVNGVNTSVQLYYILGSTGSINGKNVYVLQSQVSKTKPKK